MVSDNLGRFYVVNYNIVLLLSVSFLLRTLCMIIRFSGI